MISSGDLATPVWRPPRSSCQMTDRNRGRSSKILLPSQVNLIQTTAWKQAPAGTSLGAEGLFALMTLISISMKACQWLDHAVICHLVHWGQLGNCRDRRTYVVLSLIIAGNITSQYTCRPQPKHSRLCYMRLGHPIAQAWYKYDQSRYSYLASQTKTKNQWLQSAVCIDSTATNLSAHLKLAELWWSSLGAWEFLIGCRVLTPSD